MSNTINVFDHYIVRFALITLILGVFLSSEGPGLVFSYRDANVFSTDSVSLFSSATFTTPKSVFAPGEKAWAVGTVSPLTFGTGSPQRRIQWVAPDGSIKQQSDITTNNQTDSFQIPASAQVGTWLVKIVDNSNIGLSVAEFVVRDPANAAADLSINISGDPQIAAGSSISYVLSVTNNGPDEAQDVELVDLAPKGATFQSLENAEGWNCTTDASRTTCARGSLTRGESAFFKVVYRIDADTPANTIISNTANVSSQTSELHQPDNRSTAISKVLALACTLGCPDNLTQAHDAGMDGATVIYADTALSQSCSDVVCNPASGSFFPAGITTVVCSSGNGEHCSFKITVTGAIAINITGANPLLVECHDEFQDPEVTAQNGGGDLVPVTSSGSVDMDTVGTYTITYTATDRSSTATATRTVEVIDTTPPIISCPADTIALANADCKAVVPNLTDKLMAFDNCTSTGSLVIKQNPAAGALVGIGETTITISVKDASNNTSTCTTTFSVNPFTLGSATVLVGPKSVDDAGLKFDLLAEVLKNGKLVGSGQLNDLDGGSNSLNNSILQTINLSLSKPESFCTGDTLGIRLSARVAAGSSRRNGTVRLMLNADSNFAATVGGLTKNYFLLDGFALDTARVPEIKNTIDVFVDRAAGSNSFKPFGIWSKVF